MQHHPVNYTEIYLDKKAYGNGIQYFFKRPYRDGLCPPRIGTMVWDIHQLFAKFQKVNHIY